MKNAALSGKPYAGNPHVRFDEGEVASAKPRRGSLLYKQMVAMLVIGALAAYGDVTIPSKAEWVKPIYEVEVTSGAVDLQKVTVTVTDASGAQTTRIGVDPATVSGTIVKTGVGELKMLDRRTTFAGTIHVMEGVLRVSNMYPLGGGSATTYVHSNATLITDYSNPKEEVKNSAVYGTTVYEGGGGAAGQPGQLVMIKGSNIRAPLPTKNILLADATWNYNGNVCWDASKIIDLQGHVLTISDEGVDDATLYVDGFKAKNPGGFILDGLAKFDIREVGAETFCGNGFLKFTNGTPFVFSESYRAKYPIEWKIVADSTAVTELRGASANSFYGTLNNFPNTTWMSVGGLELSEGQDLVLSSYGTVKGYDQWWVPFAVMGTFSGTGGITYKTADSTARNWLITLGGADNAFKGGVNLYETNRLDLVNGGNALPANGGDLKMATGGILGIGAGAYTLPGAEFTGDISVINSQEDFATGAWTKPVVKKGAGTLDYGVSVGGPVLDVREGTVRLAAGYSSVAGLNKGFAGDRPQWLGLSGVVALRRLRRVGRVGAWGWNESGGLLVWEWKFGMRLGGGWKCGCYRACP